MEDNNCIGIDFSALVYGDNVSTEEAIRDVLPFEIPEEVMSGKKEIVFSSTVIPPCGAV